MFLYLSTGANPAENDGGRAGVGGEGMRGDAANAAGVGGEGMRERPVKRRGCAKVKPGRYCHGQRGAQRAVGCIPIDPTSADDLARLRAHDNIALADGAILHEHFLNNAM